MAFKIREIFHRPTGTTVDLKLDRDNLRFEAYYNGKRYYNADGHVLEEEMLQAITDAQGLEFEDAIEVEFSRGNMSHRRLVCAKMGNGIVYKDYDQRDRAAYYRYYDSYSRDDAPSYPLPTKTGSTKEYPNRLRILMKHSDELLELMDQFKDAYENRNNVMEEAFARGDGTVEYVRALVEKLNDL